MGKDKTYRKKRSIRKHNKRSKNKPGTRKKRCECGLEFSVDKKACPNCDTLASSGGEEQTTTSNEQE